MTELPDFWRTEIWHPLSVHLPLAVLLIATLFKLIAPFSKQTFWNSSGNVLLFIGTLGAWIAVYTGNLADGIVSRKICDPTVLESHEQAAYVVAWLFTMATAGVLASYFQLRKKLHKLLQVMILVAMLAGSGFLAYTGHLGATLVYQQAAGVYQPTEDCIEFTE